MSERITIRLDDAVYSRLTDAAKARGIDLSSVVRQAVIAYLEGAGGTAPTPMLHHTPEDCLAVVVSHASPRAQHHLTEVLARLDGILTRQGRSRLWFMGETLGIWAAKAELQVYEGSVLGPREGSDA
jgi:Ribbon-helix-helix protein, copG family